jgi:hypothetical protein
MKKILLDFFSSSPPELPAFPRPGPNQGPPTPPPIYSFQLTPNPVIQKGASNAGPQVNIAGVSSWR